MSFCSACGAKVGLVANFCGSCGVPLNLDGTPKSPNAQGAMYERTSLGVLPQVSAEFFYGIIADYCSRKWGRWNEKVEFMKRAYGEDWQKTSNLEPPAVPADGELDLLLQDVESLRSQDRGTLIELHNFCVAVLRAECLKDVKKYQTVKVRPDLELPRDWHTHYENLYQAQLPLLILAVVQHAFIGNPLDGELYEWSNRNALFGRAKAGNKTKLAGAAAIGAAAALLLGS